MKIKTAVGAALLVTVIHTLPTEAKASKASLENNATMASAQQFDVTRPPIGFVRFCADDAANCADYSPQQKRLPEKQALTKDQWNLVAQVNTYVNGKIKAESDQDVYGEPERWAYPVDAGDCEDYALLKQRYLVQLGISPRSLRMTVVLDEHGDGHAVLTLVATDGDYILDNRRNEILRWNEAKYTFLKRQSGANPREWVALIKGNSAVPGNLATQQR